MEKKKKTNIIIAQRLPRFIMMSHQHNLFVRTLNIMAETECEN